MPYPTKDLSRVKLEVAMQLPIEGDLFPVGLE